MGGHVTQKGADSEQDAERATITRAMQPTADALGGRYFVLLYQSSDGGTGILSNIEDHDELKATIVNLAQVVATQPHDEATIVSRDGETGLVVPCTGFTRRRC
jgi:hypothetical protein